MSRRLLNIDELAAMLLVSKQTIYRWRSEGRNMPKGIKVGQRVLWDENTVNAWLDAQQAMAA